MMPIESSATPSYQVVVNEEEQYSICCADRVPTNGWRSVGPVGSKEECLTWIANAWTDIRPVSLRRSPAR
ncbi:MbtH family protein [Streptomyces sp. NPDC059129]|uniref:MbtH family protein n=1 Tax=unclassified Streptomyces TaxID=2593676 RepID=UPI0036B7D1D6